MNAEGNSPLARLVTPNVFCRRCASPLVQALDWEHEDETSWSIVLWCPDCGHEQAAVLSRPQLLYLSMAIEEGFACILEALTELQSIAEDTGSLDFARRAQTERIRSSSR